MFWLASRNAAMISTYSIRRSLSFPNRSESGITIGLVAIVMFLTTRGRSVDRNLRKREAKHSTSDAAAKWLLRLVAVNRSRAKGFGENSRVREAFVSLTRLGGCGRRSFGSFGQELFDVLVSVFALTDFHQARKMEFHPSFDLTRRNVVTTRFQTLRQLFGTAEHAHRLAADIHLEKKRVALTGFHTINLGDDRMNRASFRGRCGVRLDWLCFCRARWNNCPSVVV